MYHIYFDRLKNVFDIEKITTKNIFRNFEIKKVWNQ